MRRDNIEGGQRGTAAIQAVFCAKINAKEGTIAVPRMLTVESFSHVDTKSAPGHDATDRGIIKAMVVIAKRDLELVFYQAM